MFPSTQIRDGCPPGRLFVPGPLRSRVLQWGHSSLLSCHPRVSRTLSLITQRFWWPSLREDAREFVSACPVCARSKVNRSPPAGLLSPLHVPHCPWSHISMDFVTGLPPSEGKTVVLTVVDRFLRWLILLPCLSCPPLERQPRQFCFMFFGSMVFLRLWCRTGVPSSPHVSGESSAGYLVRQ